MASPQFQSRRSSTAPRRRGQYSDSVSPSATQLSSAPPNGWCACKAASMVRVLAVPLVVSVLWSAQPAPTLPDHDAFVRDTRNNLARSQREQNRFAYKERRTELHTNPFGRLGSGGTLVYDVTPTEDGTVIVRKLIERDGKPVANGPVQKTDLTQR